MNERSDRVESADRVPLDSRAQSQSGEKSPPGSLGMHTSPTTERMRISEQDARQGEIILNTPLRKAVFIGGLVGIVVLAALAAWY